MGGDVWVVGRSTLVPALATHKLTSTNGHNNRLKAMHRSRRFHNQLSSSIHNHIHPNKLEST